jgi:hypothetical protein
MLRVRRDNHPEKQKQGRGTGGSNELHRDHPRLSLRVVHADHQSASKHVPAPLLPPRRPWFCAPSHPGGWAESRASTMAVTPICRLPEQHVSSSVGQSLRHDA